MKILLSFFVFIFVISGSLFLLLKPNKYDFTAQTNEKTITLSNLNGEYKIVYFGYLFCPDVCPATLSIVSEVLEDIKKDNIKLVFITLDPQRDKPDAINEYLKYFYKNSIGLSVENLENVTKNYGVKYKKIDMPDSAMLYSVAHSSSIYLLDKKGKFFTEVSNLTQEDIKEAILDMLSKRP